MLLVDMLVVVALESQSLHTSHLSIHIAVLTEVLPDTRPAGIASKVDGGAERPGHTDGTRLVSGGFSTLQCYVAVERCTDIDILREQRTTLCVGGAVVLVQSEDAGNTDVFHRQFLDVADYLLPLGGSRCTGVRCIQDGANLIFAEQRVSLGVIDVENTLCIVGAKEVGDELHHLTYLLLQCQLVNISLGRLHGAGSQDDEHDDKKFFHQKTKLLTKIIITLNR